MKTKLIAIRKKTALYFQDGEIEHFDSISKAKKESFKIQKANGGLGCGAVQVYSK